LAQIRALMERVPTRELEVRRRYAKDAEFRSICDDYEEAQRVLRHWQLVERNEARAEEYRRLTNELETEILALLDAARAKPTGCDDT
jgi:hypothetical protein